MFAFPLVLLRVSFSFVRQQNNSEKHWRFSVKGIIIINRRRIKGEWGVGNVPLFKLTLLPAPSYHSPLFLLTIERWGQPMCGVHTADVEQQKGWRSPLLTCRPFSVIESADLLFLRRIRGGGKIT
jgi:hypothetical protein